MSMRSLPFAALLPGAVLYLAACESVGSSQPTVSDRRIVADHRMTPEQVRQMTGVDRLPEVADRAALKASIARHYPAELRAQNLSGSALIDIHVDAQGQVSSVTAIPRPAGINATLILEGSDGIQRRITPNDHPAFQAAAVAALREIKFSPAVRDGQPVPFTLRMTVSFDP